MTPEPATTGIVIGHRALAAAMVDTVEAITGITSVLLPLSNEGCTPEELGRRIEGLAGAGPVVFFVDLASGSCALAARRAAAEREQAAVVAGVSLPMLLDFVFHREMAPAPLAERVAGRGRDAIRLSPSPEALPDDVDTPGSD